MQRRMFLIGLGLWAPAAWAQGVLPPGLSAADASSGLRLALESGAAAAVTRLAKVDGYWGDPQVRVPLPGALETTRQRLAPLRLSAPLDRLQLQLNRAAEKAAPQARTLLVDAVKGLSFADAASVLRGGPTAGTDVLRARTAEPLTTAFTPVVSEALGQVGALKSLDGVVAKYRLKGLLGGDSRALATRFTTQKALDGLFHYIAAEEAAIRADPLKRAGGLLSRVFGAL